MEAGCEAEFSDEDANEIAARIRSRKNCFFRTFFLLVTNPTYNFAVFIIILINTVVLAIDDFPQSVEKENTLNLFNEIFTWIFFAEMIMKMLGLGIKNYVRDNFNLFDAIVVLFSLLDYTLSQTLSQDQTGPMGDAF